MEKIDLCGLSLGGILALNYAIDYPNKVEKLVLIGTPYRVPKVMFSIQNIIFKFLPIINEESPKELAKTLTEFWKD